MMRAQADSSHPEYRSDPPGSDPLDSSDGRTSESPLDHALTLLLAGEVDSAMRWAAAVLERSPSPPALLVTCRLLDQMGRARAAVEGLKLAVELSVNRGDLPLAIAAIDDLRALGSDGREEIEMVASAFCKGSNRLEYGRLPPLLPAGPVSDFVHPLSPFLSGPSLASKAAQAVHKARSRYQEALGNLPGIRPLPLFSALSKNALVALLWEFHAVTLPAGQTIIAEGDDGGEAFVVVRGEVEISRRAAHGDNGFTLALARLRSGAFFGETALMS
ncbi:MAG: cyclic nucleotide-binding domain-containing protein, partial [Polyangiaceae bacterium]